MGEDAIKLREIVVRKMSKGGVGRGEFSKLRGNKDLAEAAEYMKGVHWDGAAPR